MPPTTTDIIQTIDSNRIAVTFVSDAFAVRQVLQDLSAYLASHAVSGDDLENVEITLGEALNNIVEHAYPENTEGKVTLNCTIHPTGLEFGTLDTGVEMPGLTPPKGAAKPDDCAFEDMPEGGFGWFMIRALSTDLEYRRHGDTNHLSFTLPLAAGFRATA